jgi:hypothetical protein
MPLVRIDMFCNKSNVYRRAIRDAVCETVADVVGLAAEDCRGVVIDHEPDNQNNLTDHFGIQHDPDAILVTIGLNDEVGLDQKGLLYSAIVRALRHRVGLASKEVALKLVEVRRQGSAGDFWLYLDARPR